MNIVLVGAGGTGMSAVGQLLHALGYRNIVAIDNAQSELTDKLKSLGMKVIIGHGKYDVQIDDFVIYSQAVYNSPEITQSRAYSKKHLKKYHYAMNYFEFLGEISKYFHTMAITGTNGKSSTTALTIFGAEHHRQSSTFGVGIVGAILPWGRQANFALAEDKKNDIKSIFDKIFFAKREFDHSLVKKYDFIVEACEYHRHFLNLDIDVAAITNMELDHTDYFEDMEDYRLAFQQFVDKVKTKVFAFPAVADQLTGDNIIPLSVQDFNFDHLVGQHHHANATLAAALLSSRKENQTQIQNTLRVFPGLWRRMEHLTTNKHGTILYTDYGHHAPALKTVLKSLRSHYPEKKITAIFQPHQARRVLEGWDAFQEALTLSDKTIVYNLYTARENLDDLKKEFVENDLHDIDTFEDLGYAFAAHVEGTYTEQFDDITQAWEQAGNEDIFIIFSAGDIDYQMRNYLSAK